MDARLRSLLPLLALPLAACFQPAELGEADFKKLELIAQWPPSGTGRPNPTNKLLSLPEDKLQLARELGRKLFHDPTLSSCNQVSCASCHGGEGFTVDKPLADGCDGQITTRNPPSLINVRHRDWFTWDGGNNTLWAQAIRPLLSDREMRSTPQRLREVLGRAEYADFEPITGVNPATEPDDKAVLAAFGKVLETYERDATFTRRALSPFDIGVRELLEARARGEEKSHPLYLGISVFMSERGGCIACHEGPLLNGQFRNAAVSVVDGAPEDLGRYSGVQTLIGDDFSSLKDYSDDKRAFDSVLKPIISAGPREAQKGEFVIPTLRNVALTAPFMHNGSLATLEEVVEHYAVGGGAKGTYPGEPSESIVQREITFQEKKALVELLEKMTSPVE